MWQSVTDWVRDAVDVDVTLDGSLGGGDATARVTYGDSGVNPLIIAALLVGLGVLIGRAT